MAVDHKRPLPVAPERLDYLAAEYCHGSKFSELPPVMAVPLLQVALLGEQVEATNNVNFFLSEAYDIYNARFR